MAQESTGFGPNDLPLTLLSDQWKEEDQKNLIEYVNGFRHRLYTAGEMAKEKMIFAQEKNKNMFNRRTERRVFSIRYYRCCLSSLPPFKLGFPVPMKA